MINSYPTYQAVLTHIDDLRREAGDRRRAILATRDPDRSPKSPSTIRRGHRPQFSRQPLHALAMPKPR